MNADETYSFAPSLLVVSDYPAEREEARAFARSAGGRLRDLVPPADGVAWLDRNGPIDALLVCLTGDPGAPLLPLLDRLEADAEAGRHAGVVSVPLGLIDTVAARVASRAVTLLADATPGEIAASAAVALVRRAAAPWLSEGGAEATRLREISEEMGRIARTLAELSGGVQEPRRGFRAGPPGEEDGDEPALTAETVRATIRMRRLRDQFFDAQLFADPAWDMLLDLAAAELEGRRVAVSSLCIAAAVPATTALRWIKMLVDAGLLVRVADPKDGRRVFIELSGTARAGIRGYFRAAQRGGPILEA